MAQKLGYARTAERGFIGRMQILAQTKQLEFAGCTSVFIDDGIAGVPLQRPALKQAMELLQSGDELVMYASHRISRNKKHVAEIARIVAGKGAELVFLNRREFTQPSNMIH